jgi:NAD(P)H-hydrate epimerase
VESITHKYHRLLHEILLEANLMSNASSPLERLSACVLSTEQVRQVDRRAVDAYGMHSLVLMENAALGCVAWIRGRIGAPVSGQNYPKTVVLCGAGNNGGDGLVIARHLRTLGWPCDVFALGPIEKLSVDARANAQILLAGDAAGIVWCLGGEPVDESLRGALADAELIIDAMLGTGFQGAPRSPFDDWIQCANLSHGFRLAIDIPTGVDATTGQRMGAAFAADATLTFVARKPAMANPQTKGLFGQVNVLPIGIPLRLIEEIIAETQG